MASKEIHLERYTKAFEALHEDIAENQNVFKPHERLVGMLIDAENDLRDAVVEQGITEPFSDGSFNVSVTPQTQTTYNEEGILAKLGMTKEAAIAAGLITVTERPPRISISKIRN